MSDVKIAYEQIIDFIENQAEKTSISSQSIKFHGKLKRIDLLNPYNQKWYGGILSMGRTL